MHGPAEDPETAPVLPGDERAGADERAEAIARFQAFAGGLERVGLEDFRQVAMRPRDDAARAGRRAAADAIAEEHGLGDVLRAARSAVREHVTRTYAGGGYRPTWAGLNWGLSTGSAADQAAAIDAAEDAVTATIVEPYLHAEMAGGLREPFELITSAHPMPATGDIPPLVDTRPAGGPATLRIALIAMAAIVALAVGGWPFVVLPVLVVGVVRHLRR